MKKKRILNSYDTQVALNSALQNTPQRCKCKLAGKLEGMSIKVGEELDFTQWNNPDTNVDEYLLILDETPLVSIQKKLFDKHFDII